MMLWLGSSNTEKLTNPRPATPLGIVLRIGTMKATALPTQAEIKELLHYDPETGVFRWRYSVAIRVKPWDVAGTENSLGYVRIKICQKLYLAHRLAWVYMTGESPKDQIDHIDGVRSNNAWVNLREATRKQNMENTSLRKNNASGFRGAHWHKRDKKWFAQVRHNKKAIFLGYFATAEEAAQVAAAKRAELFTHDMGRDKV